MTRPAIETFFCQLRARLSDLTLDPSPIIVRNVSGRFSLFQIGGSNSFMIFFNWVLVAWLLACGSAVQSTDFNSSFTPDHVRYLKSNTKNMFNHAWGSYKKHGFPYDEVRPISCVPYGPDASNKDDTVRNDVMGNFSSSIVDNLDALITMEEWDEFEKSLQYLQENKYTLFDKDVIVQVFEVTIRSLGGLLSAHLLLTDMVTPANVNERYRPLLEISKKYDGFLLDMAYDLGIRLTSAFKTSTHIPVPRINLRRGASAVPYSLQLETCTSGAASPVLEFTLLSRLTGDPQFEKYSHQTFWKLWSSRSGLDLLPMTISPIESKWMDSITGIGASVDSFYEYAVKYAVVFDDDDMWNVFKTAYKGLMTHSVKGSNNPEDPLIYANVNTDDGIDATLWLDSLSAFWSGLQVLAGQVSDAIRTHVVYWKLWNYYDSLPERWNFLLPNEYKESELPVNYEIDLEWYPLRPEFIESTYYLYRATKDPMYLQIGERIMRLYESRYKAECGFRGVQDIRTGEVQDRMETFVMSESLKYLYLLFDVEDELFVHNGMLGSKSWVFSTEAHPLWFSKKLSPKGHKSAEIDDLRLRDSVFDSLKKRIRSSWESAGTKLSDELDADVQRAPNPLIALPNRTTVDYFDAKFDKCELSPLQSSTAFMSSGYYSMRSLFSVDQKYSAHLQRPGYLQFDTENVVELTPAFFDKFSLPMQPQCRLATNTETFDLFVGDRENITVSQMDRIVGSHDYWVPSLGEMRLSFEFLTPGKVDSFGRRISKEYLRAQNKAVMGNKQIIISDAVLRITKLNGVFIQPGETIFSEQFESREEDFASGMVIINRRLMLRGLLVENLRFVDIE